MHAPDSVEHSFLGPYADDAKIYRANGCDACSHSGYRGRTGIYELLVIDDGFRELIHDRASEQALNEYARRQFPSIREDARLKVLDGTTSVQEVLRVTLDE